MSSPEDEGRRSIGNRKERPKARLCEFPGLNVPCGVQGAVACRPLCGMKAGGALEIARSAVYGTTMRVSRTRTPEQVWAAAQNTLCISVVSEQAA